MRADGRNCSAAVICKCVIVIGMGSAMRRTPAFMMGDAKRRAPWIDDVTAGLAG